jgi:hypothetical protein
MKHVIPPWAYEEVTEEINNLWLCLLMQHIMGM